MPSEQDLERFRAQLRRPTEAEAETARASLRAAIDDEQKGSPAPSLTRGRSRLFLPRGAVAGVLVAAVAAVVAVSMVGLGGDDIADTESSLRNVAATLRASSSADYEPLAAQGLTLREVAVEQAEIVGIGRIVEVREGYQEVDRFKSGFVDYYPHLLLVIEPERVTKGADLLGESGLVMVEANHPYLSREESLEEKAFEQLRDAVAGSDERVAFMLDRMPRDAMGDEIVNEFAGRSTDDPLLWPSVPSSLFGLDEKRGVAFSMTTDEVPQDVAGNVGPLQALGAEVDQFGRPDGQDVTAPAGV